MRENTCTLVANGLDLTRAPYKTQADDASFGNPVPLTTSMRGLLQDGSTVTEQGHDNREDMFFRVGIQAPDGRSIAEAEAALMLAVKSGPFELHWTPPDGWGPTTVYEVQHCTPTFLFDNLDEMRCARVFGLKMNALPFGRSVAAVTTLGVVPGNGVVVHNCDTSTAWSTSGPGVLSVDTGTLRMVVPAVQPTPGVSTTLGETTYRMVQAFTVTGTTTRVGIDVKATLTQQIDSTLTLTTSTGTLTPIKKQSGEAQPGGFQRFYFNVPAGSYTGLALYLKQRSDSPPTGITELSFWIDNLATYAAATSWHQAMLTLPVKGSVRAPATLTIAGSTGLGDTIIFTCPDLGDGYRPDLTRLRTSNPGRVADSNAFIGNTIALSTSTAQTYPVPMSMLAPGAYLILAHLKNVTSGTTIQSSSTLLGTTQTTLAATGATLVFRSLGVLNVPDGINPTLSTNLDIKISSGTGAADLDEVWLLRADGEVTLVAAGGAKMLAISPATVAHPRPMIQTGNATDGSDLTALSGTSIPARGDHVFSAGSATVFVGSQAVAPAPWLTYHPHWFNNAAE